MKLMMHKLKEIGVVKLFAGCMTLVAATQQYRIYEQGRLIQTMCWELQVYQDSHTMFSKKATSKKTTKKQAVDSESVVKKISGHR